MCQLRYDWGSCAEENLQWFYATIFAAYALTFILYSVLALRQLYFRKNLHALKFRMMISVLIYSLFGSLHGASNLYPVSVFSPLFTEYSLTLCFLFMMLAILFLITNWIYMSRIITGNLGITKAIFAKNFENTFIAGVITVTGTAALVIDTLMVYVPVMVDIWVTINLALWGAATITVGFFLSIFGGRVIRYVSSHKDLSSTNKKSYQKVRLLYLGFSILAFVYSAIYCVAIIVTIWYYSQTAWLILYGLFHLVIISTAFLLPIIFHKKIMSLQVTSSGKTSSSPGSNRKNSTTVVTADNLGISTPKSEPNEVFRRQETEEIIVLSLYPNSIK